MLGVWIAIVIEAGLAHEGFRHSILVQAIAFFAISFTLANAFNLYALLALTALGFGKQTVWLAWRWRVSLDFTIAILAVFIGFR